MRINEFMTESFQTVSINGILYSLNTDEKAIYTKVKEAGKLLKKDLSEFDARVANGMVTKGVLKRRKNPQQEIYFVTKGRRKNAPEKPIEEVAPPDSQIEKWINDNKERFEEKYGKEYKKYLYGKAWNKFNGKKMVKESVEDNTNVHSTIGDIWTNKHNHNDYEVIDIDFKSLLFNGQEYKIPLYTLKNITNSVGLPSTCDNHTLLQHYFKNTDYNGGWDGEDEETNTSLQEKCLKNSKTLKESVERLDEHVHYDVHVYDIDWDTPSDRQDVEFNLDDYEDPNSDYVYDTIRDRIAVEVGFYPASFSFEVNGVYDEDGNPYNADSEDDNRQDSEDDLPSDYWDGDSEEEIIESIFQEAYMQLNEGVDDVKKRKRKSSSMNESAGSKDELDFYKRFEGTEVEAKDDGEVFTIVDVEHDGFGIRFKLESNESDMQIIAELDELEKWFTGFVSFEKDDTENEDYWDGEDDEEILSESYNEPKFHEGQKLLHKTSREEWTVRNINQGDKGIFYDIVRPMELSNGETATIRFTVGEQSLEKDYENMDYPDDTNDDNYWDGE